MHTFQRVRGRNEGWSKTIPSEGPKRSEVVKDSTRYRLKDEEWGRPKNY